MSPEELRAFETQVAADDILKKRVEEMEFLFVGIQEAALQNQLNDFHKDLVSAEAPIVMAKRKTFSLKTWIAAAAVLILAASSLWWFLARKEGHEQLYANYFQPDPGLPTVMSTADNYAFERAMIDYKTGNYEAAIKAWSNMLTSQPNNDTLNYFLGSASLASQQTEPAMNYFEKVIAISQSAFIQDAYWYVGLAALKLGDKQKAISYIGLSNHPQKQQLLSKIAD